MKLLVLSDLHLNYNADLGEGFIRRLDNTVDVVIIAGDLSVGKWLSFALREFAMHFQNSQIIYVTGNHEWYGYSSKEISDSIMAIENNFQNFHWLENQVLKIPTINNKGMFEEKRFVGCTLWYPPTFDAIYMKNIWPDFRHIPDAGKKIFNWNRVSRLFLEKEVQEGDIVITHMMPSYKSVVPRWQNERSNAMFICDMEKLIITKKPAYWIHGHTHGSFNYKLADTQIICNPKGYPTHIVSDEPNPEFDSNLTIDI